MTKLSNGKELSAAIAEFRKEKAPTARKFNKFNYFKVEEYVKLLDQCFGVDGYSVSYSEANTVSVSPSQVVLLVKATISVYGEDGSVVYSFDGYGTHEPTREKVELANGESVPGDRAINLETLGMVGCVNALKSACTQLGCFGMRNLPEDGEPYSYGNEAQQRASAWQRSKPQVQTQTMPDAEEEKSFYVCDGIKDGGTDRSGKTVFVLPCHEIVDGKPLEKLSEIIFYSNFYKEPGCLRKLTHWNGIPERIRFKVRRISKAQQKNKDAYSAYTFRGFCDVT